jgi:putative hemolysin
VFAGSEIAVVAVRQTRIQELLEKGDRRARTLAKLRDRPERFLATVQVGITVISATAAAFGGSSIAVRLTPFFESIPAFAKHAHDIALATVIVIVSYLSIIIGELVPKSLALRFAESYALFVARPLNGLASLMRPFVWFLTKSSNIVLRPFGDSTTFTETRHSPEELQQLVDEATKAGTVHPAAGEIASRALDFGTITAADVMVPRQDVVMLPRRARPEEVQRILLERTHTRLPVYEGQADNVVGYVSVKDLLAFAWENRLVILEDVLRPAYFVPETQRAVELLQDMRKKRAPLAVVVDEQGGVSGIVTFEDLLEELVGELFSEHARRAPQVLNRDPDGSVVVAGSMSVRELNRDLDLDLPEDGDFTTVAGLYLELAGHIPRSGEKLDLPTGITLEVVEASPRKIRSVRLRPAPEAPPVSHD